MNAIETSNDARDLVWPFQSELFRSLFAVSVRFSVAEFIYLNSVVPNVEVVFPVGDPTVKNNHSIAQCFCYSASRYQFVSSPL